MDSFQTKKKIIRQQQIKKHERKKQRFCSIYSTISIFEQTRFVGGWSWYDRHHHSTPKAINNQTEIFKNEWQEAETQSKKKKLTKGKCK